MGKNVLTIGLAAVAVALTLAGCSTTAAAPGAEPSGASDGAVASRTEVLASRDATADDIVGTWMTGESYTTSVKPYLTVRADGTWRSSDGCNAGGGTWALAPDGAVSVQAGPSTLKACDGASPGGAFADASRILVQGSSLILEGNLADGAPSVLLPADDPSYGPPAPLVGRWSSPDGTFLQLSADGTLVGEGVGGCPSLGGHWTSYGDDSVQFSGIYADAIACPGGQSWVTQISGAVISGNTMVLYDGSPDGDRHTLESEAGDA